MEKNPAPRRTIRLTRLFLAGMIGAAALSLSIISYSWVLSEKKHSSAESIRLREEYIASRKAMLKNEVGKVLEYIAYMRDSTEDRLKTNIQMQIQQACTVANALYEHNKTTLPPLQLKNLVRETIRPVRFNNGRGYYFAVGMNGIEQLFADRPEMEGKDLSNMTDSNGKPVIRDMIRIARTQKKGFYSYTWTHPKLPGNNHKKISYIQYVPFLDWLLGTGEYASDVEGDIQKEVLQRISKIRFDRDGYIYVIDFNDRMLSNDFTPQWIGQDIKKIPAMDGVTLSKRQKNALTNPNGLFIQYHWLKPSSGEITPKLSFVRAYHEWGWYIGAGIYTDEIEAIILENNRKLRENLKKQIIKTILLSLLILIGVSAAVLWFCRKLGRELRAFISFLKNAATNSAFINTRDQTIHELHLLAESTNHMLEKRRLMEEELKESETRFRDLADLLPQTIFEIDPLGYFTFVNKHGFGSFGFTPEDLHQGLNIQKVIHQNQYETLLVNMNRVLQGEWSPGREYLAVGKSGKTFPILTYSAPVCRNGKAVGIRGISIDISALKRTQLDLKQARDEAEAASLTKSQFLANMSHEIRTPLNGIIGFAEILSRKTNDPENLEMLNLILSSGQTLMDLVNNILDLSRVEANRLELEKIPLNPRALADLVTKKYRGMAEEKGLILIKRLDPLIPDIVLGDPLRVEQILANLISNAIKFTLNGKIEFTLQLTRMNSETAAILFSVSDTGIGIPEEKIAIIFDKFTQTENFITRKYGGAGLGLTIVKKLVELMDGVITVQSAPNLGSLFTAIIPFSLPKPTLPAAPPDTASLPPTPPTIPSNWRILVAEDNTINQKLIQRLAQIKSWKTDIADNGEEAVEKFRENTYDLILMDVQMPRLNGLEACERIREYEQGGKSRIPIIALTAFAMKGDREKCLEAGMDDYISKPIIADHFYAIIDRVMGISPNASP